MDNNYITVKDAASKWKLTERRVTEMCNNGSIYGATKIGRVWLIPEDSQKPSDKRVKSGMYCKLTDGEKLPLPVGIFDYKLASSDYYYVDKTLLIKEIIDERAMVSLFTRPRRFGKSLNMDMIKTFFEISKDDTSRYFKNMKIWKCGSKYKSYQGKYPVIYLCFKDIKYNSWQGCYDSLKKAIKKEAYRHIEVRNSERCNEYERMAFEKIITGEITENELADSLADLSSVLHSHFGIAPIIIIDEYDIPIQQGYISGYYKQVIDFMRNLFSGGLKDNKNLSFGFLTGVLRVSKESIFSGLNNLSVNSLLDNKYSSYFGFTSEEVKEMCEYYNESEKYDEICEWYDGYRFGKTEIFNPWSVINYFNNDCEPKPFWLSTGNNDMIADLILSADKQIYDDLVNLFNGETVSTIIDTSVIYPHLKNDAISIYSFLVVAGYLKVIKAELFFTGDQMCEVALPNKEISFVYKKEILSKLSEITSDASISAIQTAIYKADNENLKKSLGTLLKRSASYFDTTDEKFYHGFMLGICCLLSDYYTTSNRESGNGRYDIQLFPLKKDLPGIIIELKYVSKDVLLKEGAKKALLQIEEKNYEFELKNKGVNSVIKYGLAFRGKEVELLSQQS